MATITLTADTNYSALTVANDDTIDCAGFILTLDVAPTETGVQVTSPGTNGRVVFSGAWVLPTWDFFAGTVIMIETLPEDATIKSVTGGTASGARGINTNNGTVTTANGAGANGSHGIFTNNGTVVTANGGEAYVRGVETNNGTVTTSIGGNATNAFGVGTNNGTVTTSIGGSASNAYGINNNNGTVTTANGGGGSAHGINTNNGTVTTANGGSAFVRGVENNNGTVVTANGGGANGAHGILTNNGTVTTSNGGSVSNAHGIVTNNGLCLRLTDSTGKGVSVWNGSRCFVEGPHIDGVIPDNIKTIYSLGTLSASATIAEDADVIKVSKGKGLTGIR